MLFRKVSRIKIAEDNVAKIKQYISDGAITFLHREYTVIYPFIVGVAVLLALLSFVSALMNITPVWDIIVELFSKL